MYWSPESTVLYFDLGDNGKFDEDFPLTSVGLEGPWVWKISMSFYKFIQGRIVIENYS